MSGSDQPTTVRDLFGGQGSSYDARQYGAGYRTLIADRQDVAARVIRDLSLPVGSMVLDVACGPGHLVAVESRMGLRALGYDASADMLRTARARVGAEARLARGDALELPFAPCSVDSISCLGLIEYLPNALPLLREMFRVLRPGGYALVGATNRLSPAFLSEPVVEAIRRSPAAKRLIRALGLPFDEKALRERTFSLTFHSPRRLSAELCAAGFAQPRLHYYHFQVLPSPLDRVAPRASSLLVRLGDGLLRVPGVRGFAAGLLAVARRPSQ